MNSEEPAVAVEQKPRVAAALANIAAFVPMCLVCGDPVPAKRATSRSKDTCGPECHKVLRLFRKYVNDSKYCVTCRHPCTPEERADFRRWRKDRGEIREKQGRPKRIKQSVDQVESAGSQNEKTLDPIATV